MEKYIGVDYHGPKDFEKSFREIEPGGITLYFYHTNQRGNKYCQRDCEHCSLRALPEYHIPLRLAGNICQSLKERGYNVRLFPTDSYSPDVMKHLWPIPCMATDSWTSGTPLLKSDWKDLLSRGYNELGYRSITLCGYGIGDTPVPFRGVISTKEIEEVIARIHLWNQNNSAPMKIKLTLTIHRGNCDFANLEKMIKASQRMRVDKIRFNCFVNYRDNPSLRGYELDHPILVDRFYRDLAELFRKHKKSSLEFEVSENFGDSGIGQIHKFMSPVYRDQRIGNCNAGWRLFAIVKIDGRIVVVGCVDRLGPVLGQVIEGGRGSWHIEWNTKKIHTIRDWRQSLYGCWGGIGATEGFNHPKVTQMIFS